MLASPAKPQFCPRSRESRLASGGDAPGHRVRRRVLGRLFHRRVTATVLHCPLLVLPVE